MIYASHMISASRMIYACGRIGRNGYHNILLRRSNISYLRSKYIIPRLRAVNHIAVRRYIIIIKSRLDTQFCNSTKLSMAGSFISPQKEYCQRHFFFLDNLPVFGYNKDKLDWKEKSLKGIEDCFKKHAEKAHDKGCIL